MSADECFPDRCKRAGQLAGYNDMAVSGMGVAIKVAMFPTMITMGIGQGIQPLLGYCVGARLWDRFKSSFKFSVIFAFLISVIMTGACYLGSAQIVGAFLTTPEALGYAVSFSRILLSTTCLVGIFFVLVNALQAMGAATPSLIINLSRQGLVYIPALFILNAVLGVTGLAWAQPLADIISLLLSIAFYARTLKKLSLPVQASRECGNP